MANRYAEDIRRIAGTDDLSSAPEKNPEKDSIRGRRGIAYIKPDGSIGGASGESGATTQPSDGKGGENAPAEEGGSYGSNTSGSGVTVKNEGGTESDQPGENNLGIIPAESLADGTAGVGDSFDGTELYDCGSGQKYTVRSDGQFTAPEGWDYADTPPTYPNSYYLSGTGPNGCRYSGATINSVISAVNNSGPFVSVSEIQPILKSEIESWESFDAWFGSTSGPYGGETLACGGDPWGGVFGASIILDGSVQNSIYSFGIRNDGGPAEASSWPASSPAQLSWDPEQAAFFTSEYDTNVDQKYKDNNVGELNMCDSSGNPVQIQAGKDGGLVYTFSGGVVVVKDASGKIVAGVSLSNKDQYLAKQT